MPRFRTIQVCPEHQLATPWQADTKWGEEAFEVDVIAFVDAVELCELPSRQARQPTGIRDVRQRDLAMAVESEKPFREDSPTSEFHRPPRIFKSSRSGQEQASARARA